MKRLEQLCRGWSSCVENEAVWYRDWSSCEEAGAAVKRLEQLCRGWSSCVEAGLAVKRLELLWTVEAVVKEDQVVGAPPGKLEAV